MDFETFLSLRGYAAEVLGEHLAGTKPDAARDVDFARAIAQHHTLTATQVHAAGLLMQAAAMRLFSAPIKALEGDRDGDIPALDRDEYARAALVLCDRARSLAAHLPPGAAAELLRIAQPVSGVQAGTPKAWTPERLADLRACRKQHGTKKAAEQFGVSAARVRELLPADKLPQTIFSVFNPRSK